MEIKCQDSTELKAEGNELFREMISFSVGDKRADMLAKIYSNGEIITYNMDNNCYYSDDRAVRSPLENEISTETLDDLCKAAEIQVRNDYGRIQSMTMKDNALYSNRFEFNAYEDMTNIVDSMQISSGTVIADLKGTDANGKAIDAYIIVHGEVSVTFEGEDYDDPADFPVELKEIIKQDRLWADERVYVSNNNWFELVVNEGYDAQVIDCEGSCVAALYESLAEAINDEIDNGSLQAQKLPVSHCDFVMDGGGSYVNYQYTLPEGLYNTIYNMGANEKVQLDGFYNDIILIVTKDADYNKESKDNMNVVNVDFQLNGKSIATTEDIHVTELEEILSSIRNGEVQGTKTLVDETRTLPQIEANEKEEIARQKELLTAHRTESIIGLQITTNDFQNAEIVATQGNEITCRMNDSMDLRTFSCDELINNQDDKSVREALKQYKEEHKEDVASEITNKKQSVGR